jgi:hypothetical protein
MNSARVHWDLGTFCGDSDCVSRMTSNVSRPMAGHMRHRAHGHTCPESPQSQGNQPHAFVRVTNTHEHQKEPK